MSRYDPSNQGTSLVVGVSALASMYGMGKRWARNRLREWWDEQARGGPRRCVRRDRDGALFTTMAVIHQWMPPGRDIELHRRIRAVEGDVETIASRLDNEVTARTRSDVDITRRIALIESRARKVAAQ